jgi:hypothetical protein
MPKYILTAPSSFTGYWIIKKLLEKFPAEDITCIGSSLKESYTDLYKTRISEIRENRANVLHINNTREILKCVESIKPKYFHFHSAYTKNYQSETFDLVEAIKCNNLYLEETYKILSEIKCISILTGSYFQKYDYRNLGSSIRYAISKNLNEKAHDSLSEKYGVKLLKLVIPNPYGPLENKKLNNYVFECLRLKKEVVLKFPKAEGINVLGAEVGDDLLKIIQSGNSSHSLIDNFRFVNNNQFVEGLKFLFEVASRRVELTPKELLEEILSIKKITNTLLPELIELHLKRIEYLLDYILWIRKTYK